MRFQVENMTCSHCERAIRKAIAALSPQATVSVDLRGKTLSVDGPLSAAQVVEALAEEGYPAARLAEPA